QGLRQVHQRRRPVRQAQAGLQRRGAAQQSGLPGDPAAARSGLPARWHHRHWWCRTPAEVEARRCQQPEQYRSLRGGTDMTRAIKVRLIAFVILSAIGIVYVAGNYLGLVDRILGRGYTVHATLPESGGLFEGSEVTYRGVKIGRVSKMEVSTDG